MSVYQGEFGRGRRPRKEAAPLAASPFVVAGAASPFVSRAEFLRRERRRMFLVAGAAILAAVCAGILAAAVTPFR